MQFWVEPADIKDLQILLKAALEKNISLRIIGAGSNVLVSSQGLKGIVAKLNSPIFKKISIKNQVVDAGAGASLRELINSTQEKGLAGLQFLVGIPGTVGGALVANAGVNVERKSYSIGDLVEEITVMDYNGRLRTLNKKQIRFGYRSSNLSKYIILSARLRLKKGDRQNISQDIQGLMGYRRRTQELSRPSAGCIFKNPMTRSAGSLIDLCGLKGTRKGDACVSSKHANFIVNLGDAQACDVLKLMDLIQKKVREKFGVILEPEIKIWS